MTLPVVVTDRCPGCGRPFVTEVTLGVSHTVICQHGHTFKVLKTVQHPGKREFTLEMKKKEDERGAATAGS